MNRLLLHTMVCSGILLSMTSGLHAQPLTVRTVLPASSRCDHVIQMMLRHGVNNSFDRSNTQSLLNQSPFGGIQVPITEFGDLQIAQVTQLPPEAPVAGPKFAIVVMNQSNRAVCNFHVSLVAVFGSICPNSQTRQPKCENQSGRSDRSDRSAAH